MWNSESNNLPATLEEAHAEIIRLREHNEFKLKKEKLISEVEGTAREILESSPTYRYIQKIPYLVNAEGATMELPSTGIVALYFGIDSCGACKKFEPLLLDFLESNQDKGFWLINFKTESGGSGIIDAFPNMKNVLSLPREHCQLAPTLRKELKVAFFPTLIVVDFSSRQVVTRFGREAVEAERISGQALAAWKNGFSGFFPSFFERKRKLNINPLGMFIWFVTCAVILYFVFGFTFEAVFTYWYKLLIEKKR